MSSLALSYALNLLSRRDYSEQELRRKMQEKAFEAGEIEQVIAHCQQRNWQNDRRFCEHYVQSRAQRGYGLNRIKQELRQLKGIESAVLESVLQETEVDWAAVALKTLGKKFPDFADKQDTKNKQKIWRYMLSHGFRSDEFADYIGRGRDWDEE